MTFKEFVRSKLIPSYFVSVCLIALTMGVLGMAFEPDARFGYGVLFFPFIFGLIAAGINLVCYTPKALTLRQAMVREIMQLALIEGGIMAVLWWGGALGSAGVTTALALSIAVIYGAAALILWMNDRRTSDALNKALRQLQAKNSDMDG